MSTPYRWGGEFLVNTATNDDQNAPRAAGLADGRFVVVWEDSSQTGADTSGDTVRAQFFSADGSPDGAAFVVPAAPNGHQVLPAVAALDDGGFIATWTDWSQSQSDTDSTAVFAQRFNGDGTRNGTDFQVNTTELSSQTEPDVTALAGGGFAITWTDSSETGGDTDLRAVRAQVYGEDGAAVGGELLVNTTTTLNQEYPAIAGLDNGGFVVTYSDFSNSPGIIHSETLAQRFDANGTAIGGEIAVNTTIASNQDNSVVAPLANGGFVIAFNDYSLSPDDSSSWAIRAQVIGADGTLLHNEFLVPTTTTNAQQDPAIATLPDGRFVIAWRDQSWSHGENNWVIRAQVFNSDGTPSGGEILVNPTTNGDQFFPTVTALADGRFVVGWEDHGQNPGDTDGTAVRAQIIDPRLAAADLAGTTMDDDLFGTGFDDRLAGFLGDDTLRGGAGDDRIEGEDGADTLGGGWGNDRLFGGDGDDTLMGQFGRDRLYGNDGNDVLNGGFGFDYMVGGAGNDTYVVDRAGDVIVETATGGTDTVRSETRSLDLTAFANVENLTLTGAADLNGLGSNGDNVLTGNDGDNVLHGRAGDDRLNGGAGDDVLIGSAGRDILIGGAGADTFDFNTPSESGIGAANRDRIAGFVRGEDVIDLSTIDAATGPGNHTFTFIGAAAFSGTRGELRVIQSGALTIVQADRNGDGVRDFEFDLTGAPALDASDFIL